MTTYVIREIMSDHPSTSFEGEGVRLYFFEALDDAAAKDERSKLLRGRYPEHSFHKLVPVSPRE